MNIQVTEERLTVTEAPDVHLSVSAAGAPTLSVASSGLPGAPGPPGPPGLNGTSGAGASMTQHFAVASLAWTIVHNFGTYEVEVLITDENHNDFIGLPTRPDPNTVVVHFDAASAGYATVKV